MLTGHHHLKEDWRLQRLLRPRMLRTSPWQLPGHDLTCAGFSELSEASKPRVATLPSGRRPHEGQVALIEYTCTVKLSLVA